MDAGTTKTPRLSVPGSSDLKPARPGITVAKAKKLQARVVELTARPGPWSVRDIAEETGWSTRSVQRMAINIPGALFEGGRFRFQRTADLADWLFIQRGRFQARCNGLRRAKRPPLPGGVSEHIQHLRAMPENLIWQMRAAFFLDKARLPLREWTIEDLQTLLHEVESHSRVVCEELRAELETRKPKVESRK